MSRVGWGVVGVGSLLGAWQLVVWAQLVNPVLLPGPITVGRELGRLVAGPLGPDLAASLSRILAGLGLAIAVGVPLGLLIGASRRAADAFALPLDLYRSVPAVALVPLFVILLGIGETAKIGLAAGAVAPVIVVTTSYGVGAVRAARWRLIRSLRMSRWQALRLVIVPESLPHVFAGLRIGASTATTVVVAAEMLIGTHHGLGRRIYDAQQLFRIPELYATIVVTGLVGLALNRVLLVVERRTLHWVGQ